MNCNIGLIDKVPWFDSLPGVTTLLIDSNVITNVLTSLAMQKFSGVD